MDGYSFSAVVQGALHKREGLDCQDYAGSSFALPSDGFVFAVSDGHGDPACVRSALGSRFAVEVALRRLGEFVQEQNGNKTLLDASKKQEVLKELCASIVRKWRERVAAHLESYPLSSEQWEALGERGRQISKERPTHLYGATLVAGLATPHLLLLLQQGDGFCVVIDSKGNQSSPISEDDRCIGNVTTSLCDADAAQRMRFCVLDMQQSPIIACFVGSDGVDKSLWGTEGLFDLCNKLALDTLGNLSQQDMEANLRLLLNELSEMGCGDDASLAGFANVSNIACIAPTLVNNRMRFGVTSELEQLRSQLNSMKRMHERYTSHTPTTQDEKDRRDSFLQDYDGVEQRIQELEDQLGVIDSESTEQKASLVASFMSSSGSVHIKPAAHFPKSYDGSLWEPEDTPRESESSLSQEEVSPQNKMPIQENVGEVVDQNTAIGNDDPVGNMEPAETVKPIPNPQVVANTRPRIQTPFIVVIGVLLVLLVAGIAILLRTSVLQPVAQSPKASMSIAEEGTVGITTKEERGPKTDADDKKTTTQDATEEIKALNGEFIRSLGAIRDDETDQLEQVLGLGSEGQQNELYNIAFGNISSESSNANIEISPSGDAALVTIDFEFADLKDALSAERENSFDGKSVYWDSLLQRVQNERKTSAIPITLVMRCDNEKWDIWHSPSVEDVISELLEESGYLECLRVLAEQDVSQTEQEIQWQDTSEAPIYAEDQVPNGMDEGGENYDGTEDATPSNM